MVSRLTDPAPDASQEFELAVEGALAEPDRQLIDQARQWFRASFAEAPTPRSDQAWRVARMLADIQAHPACTAVALFRAVPWEQLRPGALVRTLADDVAAMLGDLDRGDRVLERLEDFGQGGEAAAAVPAGAVHDAEAVRKLMLALAQDVRTVVVVLAERLDALRAAAYGDEMHKRRLARQTMALHAPLANRIGVWQFKWELEDLSFRFLEPDTYRQIAKLLDERRTDRERWIADVIADLRGELAGRGIHGEVQGRPKHIYSIWKKMRQKGLSFAQLMDVRAVRVIVDTVEECYQVLGVVQDKWTPVEGEFDDYIAHPKGNFYRSLHTAVLGPEGRPLEVQIRTVQMHRDSELGVAAHWRYKEGNRADRRFDERIVWLRQMLEWGRELNPGADSGPVDDTIYVFTPQGRVIDLPKGATPVDFAYHVHTDLGHRCRGARVDGAIVPLHHRLESGQRVEITVARQGGPSRDWLNPELGFLHSPRALAKVRHWFKQQNLEEDLAHGRQLLDQAIKRAGRGQPNLEKVAQELGLRGTEELLVALARNEVPQRALEQALAPPPPAGAAAEPDVVRQARPPEAAKGSGVIHVLGVSNIASNFAKCCRPVPPEPVIGFVTRNHGVTIHREDCESLKALSEEQRARLIPAAWGNTEKDQFAVDIAVEAHDRQGLLRDISDAMTREKINVTAVNTLSRGDDAHMQFTVQIAHLGQLAAALKNLAAVPGVRKAYRR